MAFCDGEPSKSRLDTFKGTVQKGLVVDYFREPLDLAVKVASSIGRYLIQNPERMAIAAVDAQAAADRARLIELLETRGTTIARELPANERDRFQALHRLNLAAIRRGELLLSHLLTDEIHHVLWSNQWGSSWEPRSGNLYGHPNGYLHEFNASAYPRSTSFAGKTLRHLGLSILGLSSVLPILWLTPGYRPRQRNYRGNWLPIAAT
jgi:hypothetical protein